MKAVVKECKSNQHLEPLVKPDTPPDIMRHILAEFAAMLPNDVNMRRSFVTSGALMHMQVGMRAPPLIGICMNLP